MSSEDALEPMGVAGDLPVGFAGGTDHGPSALMHVMVPRGAAGDLPFPAYVLLDLLGRRLWR